MSKIIIEKQIIEEVIIAVPLQMERISSRMLLLATFNYPFR